MSEPKKFKIKYKGKFNLEFLELNNVDLPKEAWKGYAKIAHDLQNELMKNQDPLLHPKLLKSFNDFDKEYYNEPYSEEKQIETIYQRDDKNYYIFIKDLDINEYIGLFRYSYYPKIIGNLDVVYLREKYRRNGIINLMMIEFIKEMKRVGCISITLGVLTNNLGAKKLYNKLGFDTYHETMFKVL